MTFETEVILQPVVSIKKKEIVGVEAVFPRYAALREQAVQTGATLELERALRQKALAAFKPYQATKANALLFMHFDAAVIDQGVVGSGKLQEAVRVFGLNPNTIVIEISESHVRDIGALQKFISAHKTAGFLIALGEVGSGHSNLVRIAQTEPDILKADASLVAGVGAERPRREIFRAVVQLAKSLGALSVADGVSCAADALALLEMGGDIMQGDCFTGPGLAEKILRVAEEWRAESVKKAKSAKTLFRGHEKEFNEMVKKLERAPAGEFNALLEKLVHEHPGMECLYVLDEKGRQVTDTVSPAGKLLERRLLFRPAVKGADHSSKDYYFLLLDTFISRFVTEPYTSLASGRLCVTLSGAFSDETQRRNILCVDFPAENSG